MARAPFPFADVSTSSSGDSNTRSASAPSAITPLFFQPIARAGVSVAIRIGRLSLSVRSADRPLTTTSVIQTGTTWGSDVSPALGTDVAQGTRSTLHVFTGTADGKEFHF